MDAPEKRIRRIVYKNGGMIFDVQKNKIISEFMCTKRAAVCCKELNKLGRVKASKAGGRITAIIKRVKP